MTTLPFGKYRGRDIKDVPTSYLRWVVTTDGELYKKAEFPVIEAIVSELKRRNVPTLYLLTDHALLRARQRLMHIYIHKAWPGEPLDSWLKRVTKHVVENGVIHSQHIKRKGKRFKYTRFEYLYKGFLFVIEGHDAVKTLVTVYEKENNT